MPEVKLFPPAPLGTGTPYPWQGALTVPYGVVNPANGNLMLSFTLTEWSGKGPDVEFTLYYNSQDTRVTVLGTGWRHSFLAAVKEAGRISYLGTTYCIVQVHEPDGRLHEFYWKEAISGLGQAMRGIDDVLEKLQDGRYRLIRHNQMKWYFDSAGRLIEIRDLQNRALVLSYNPDGTLQRVRDAVGRTLQFSYENGRLRTITDPLQRVWVLHYNTAGRLERLELPTLEYEGVVEVRGASFVFGYTNGKLSQVTDPMGRVVSFSYRDNEWIGFVQSGGMIGGILPRGSCNPSGSFLRVVTYEIGVTRFTYVYDAYRRLTLLFDG